MYSNTIGGPIRMDRTAQREIQRILNPNPEPYTAAELGAVVEAMQPAATEETVELSTRDEQLKYAGETLGKSHATAVVDLYGALSVAQQDGQLRGAQEPAEFNQFVDSIAEGWEANTPRIAVFEGALESFPGADPQNLFRFVEAQY